MEKIIEKLRQEIQELVSKSQQTAQQIREQKHLQELQNSQDALALQHLENALELSSQYAGLVPTHGSGTVGMISPLARRQTHLTTTSSPVISSSSSVSSTSTSATAVASAEPADNHSGVLPSTVAITNVPKVPTHKQLPDATEKPARSRSHTRSDVTSTKKSKTAKVSSVSSISIDHVVLSLAFVGMNCTVCWFCFYR